MATKKRTRAPGGSFGFLAVLLAALLWKLGLFGGGGGPIPTEGGAASRAAAKNDRSASRPTVLARVVAAVSTPEPERAPQLGRVVGLFRADAPRPFARGLTGVDGAASFAFETADVADALAAGAISARLVDRSEAAAVPVATAPSVGAGASEATPAYRVALVDDLLPPPTPLVSSGEESGGTASSPTTRAAPDDAPPPDDLDEGPARVFGAVVYGDGAPAAATPVRLLVSGGSRRETSDDRSFVGSTDAFGRFQTSIAPGAGLLIELRVGASGSTDAPFVRAFGPLVADARRPVSCGVVTLSRDVLLCSGVVRDADGRPVPGAAAALRPTDATRIAITARADSDGRFTLAGPEDVGSFEVFAETEDLVGRAAESLASGAMSDVTLSPPARVTGRVVAPDPSILPHVEVLLETESGARVAAARAARDGGFRFVHVAPGRYRVRAFAPDDPGAEAICEARSGETTTIETPFDAAPTYVATTIRCVDASGAAAATAKIEVSGGPFAAPRRFDSDAEGRVIVWAAPASSDAIFVRAVGSEGRGVPLAEAVSKPFPVSGP